MEVRIENIPTDELIPHPDNLRIYGENPYVGDLVTSIKEQGILRPIIIDQDKRIIDGVRRWTASKTLELEIVPCEIRELGNEDSAISAILTYNRYRQKTPRQIFNESRELKRIETEKAKKRKRGHKPISAGALKGQVRDILSTFFKMGHTKFEELEAVFESENVYPDIAEKVADGTWSVHRGYTKIRETIQKQKDVEDMKAKISEALSHVKRESLREELEEKYLTDEANLTKTSMKEVKTDINRRLGLPVDPDPPELWKKIKREHMNIAKNYRGNSESRQWMTGDRKYVQTVTWIDVGDKPQKLTRTEYPEERFTSYEEADSYAEVLGGYCNGLHKIGKKKIWVLLVKQ